MSEYTMTLADKARMLRRYIERGVQALELDTAEAIEATALYPAWRDGNEYAVGQRVQYEGILYSCLTAHTAQAAWTPTDAPSLWARVLIPDSAVVPEWQQPDSTNPYMTGDRVTYDGKTWESTVDNNVWAPGVYGWIEVAG